jgi:iron-sulfur cluster assembly protein
MSIQLTQRAAQQIQRQLGMRGSGIGLRLGVKQAGCSGFAYTLEFADELAADETVFERFGVKVLVKQADLDKLSGIELDYAREGFNEAFKFNNPNAKSTCGCGESFSV